MMLSLLPRNEFYELMAAVDDSCDVERKPRLVEEFLSNLEQTGTAIADQAAVERLPGSAFGGAFARGDTFTINASEALKVLSASEISLVYAQAEVRGTDLRNSTELAKRFPRALGGER